MEAQACVLEQREMDTVSDVIEVCNKYTEEKWQTSPRPTYTALAFMRRFKQIVTSCAPAVAVGNHGSFMITFKVH